MAEIKPVEQAAAKWVRNAQSATQSYQEGVANPRRPWQAATTAAAQAWQAGVQAAAARNAFASGVQKTPEDQQRGMAMTKGAARYAEGAAMAENKYATNFAPYVQVIRATQLPPRGPRGAEANLQRVQVIARALHARRTQSGGR